MTICRKREKDLLWRVAAAAEPCLSRYLNNTRFSFYVSGLEKQINQEEDESSNDNEQASAALRIRKTQHATTIHMLVEALAEFNAEQIDYKEKCEERMQKVVSIGKG